MKYFLNITLFYIPAVVTFLIFLLSCTYHNQKGFFSIDLKSSAYFAYDVSIEPRLLKKWFWVEPFQLVDMIRDKKSKVWFFTYKLEGSENTLINEINHYNVIWKESESNVYENPYGDKMYKWGFMADGNYFESDFEINIYPKPYQSDVSSINVKYQVKQYNVWLSAVNKLYPWNFDNKFLDMFTRLQEIVEDQWGKKLEWDQELENTKEMMERQNDVDN